MRAIAKVLFVVAASLNACSSGSNAPDAVATGDALASSDAQSDAADENQSTADNNGPARDSNLTIDDRRYPLNAALGDIWGVSDNHYNVNFTLTDGNFRIEPTEIDGEIHSLLTPANATAVFYAEMYHPGGSFLFTEFDYIAQADQVGTTTGVAFFDHAHVSIDFNNNGAIDADENLAIVGGRITFSGLFPDIALQFSVTLQSGQIANGRYSGLFDFTER